MIACDSHCSISAILWQYLQLPQLTWRWQCWTYALRSVSSLCDECSYHFRGWCLFFCWCVGRMSVHVDISSSWSHGGAISLSTQERQLPHNREFACSTSFLILSSACEAQILKPQTPRPRKRPKKVVVGVGASSSKHSGMNRQLWLSRSHLEEPLTNCWIHSSPCAANFGIVCGRGCFRTGLVLDPAPLMCAANFWAFFCGKMGKNYGRALRAQLRARITGTPPKLYANYGRGLGVQLGAQFKGAVRGEGWVHKT